MEPLVFSLFFDTIVCIKDLMLAIDFMVPFAYQMGGMVLVHEISCLYVCLQTLTLCVTIYLLRLQWSYLGQALSDGVSIDHVVTLTLTL